MKLFPNPIQSGAGIGPRATDGNSNSIKYGLCASTTRFVCMHTYETFAVRRLTCMHTYDTFAVRRLTDKSVESFKLFRGLVPASMTKIGKPTLIAVLFYHINKLIGDDKPWLSTVLSQLPVNSLLNSVSVLKTAKQGSNDSYKSVLESFKPLGRFSPLYYGLELRTAQSAITGLGSSCLWALKDPQDSNLLLFTKTVASFLIPSYLCSKFEALRIRSIVSTNKPKWSFQLWKGLMSLDSRLLTIKILASATTVGFATAKTHNQKILSLQK